MPRRNLIIALALVVALTAITPTLGSTGTQSLVDKSTFPVRTAKKAKEIAKQAKKIAKQALTAAQVAQATADTAQQLANDAQTAANEAKASAAQAKSSADAAQSSANAAKSSADAAQTSANGAQTSANNAQASADANAAALVALRAKTDLASGTVFTGEENDYVELPTGAPVSEPNVTVTVPASGMIEVWAQFTTTDGAVSLYDETGGTPLQVPDQDPNDICSGGASSPPPGPLLSVPGGSAPPDATISTPGDASLFGYCGSTGAPAPELFVTSAGQHTFSLRYASCGCSAPDPAEFSDRMLTVAPRP